MKITFVILHYLTVSDTMNSVDAIKKNIKCQCRIIIVDNASKNGSGEYLKNYYSDDDIIDVVLNKKNMGFSMGNNVGFRMAKKDNPDFIILCNNDTILLQDDFVERLRAEYKRSHFAVLGPRIILADDSNNEIRLKLQSENELVSEIKALKRKKKITESRLLWLMYRVYIEIKQLVLNLYRKLKRKDSADIKLILKRHENIVLHGCFLVFSREYINRFDGLDEMTFLYREEDFLALKLKLNNMNSIYTPDIVIRHNEDSSTNALFKNERLKVKFVLSEQIKATEIFLNTVRHYKKAKENA